MTTFVTKSVKGPIRSALWPLEKSKTFYQGILEDEGATTLLKLLNDVDQKSLVSGEGPFTIFAPTNAAFEKLDPNLVSTLNQVS